MSGIRDIERAAEAKAADGAKLVPMTSQADPKSSRPNIQPQCEHKSNGVMGEPIKGRGGKGEY